MTVIVLTNCPTGLRGHLNLWLMEVKSGVFVGNVSARVREALWARVVELCKDGDAIMVQPANNDQGMTITSHRHKWTPIDHDGVTLMCRPTVSAPPSEGQRPRSKAGKRLAYGRPRRADAD